MKIFAKDKIMSCLMLMTAVIAISLTMTSCMPDAEDNGGVNPGGTNVDAKPDPEGTRQMALYSYTGDNIAGLGYSPDGTIKSLSPTVTWLLASVGEVPGLGNVDYIPMDGWEYQVTPKPGLGFVGYSPTQGFVRFFVAGMVVDEMRDPIAVGVKYLGGFTGSDKAVELDKTAYSVPAEGASITAKLQGKDYTPFQMGYTADWLDVHQASTIYSFINNLIEIEAKPNDTDEERTAEIVLTTLNGVVSRISIVQAANPNATSSDSEGDD